jgi:hypothetical protein
MLKDRKLLVEQEITKLSGVAAHMYLDAIRSGTTTMDEKYDQIRTKITELQHERKMIQLLLEQGYE